MRRLALVAVAVLVGATACGTTRVLRSTAPPRSVLVYAKPVGQCCYPPSTKPDRIWVASPDGSHRGFLAIGDEPVVSPDGRYVAFVNDGAVLVIPTAGGATTEVGSGHSPTWAPNSQFLAFDRASGRVVVDLDTGKQLTTIPYDGEDELAFSPDSERIAYGFDYDLYVVPTRGGSTIRLTDDHNLDGIVWGKPGIAFGRDLTRPLHGRKGDASRLSEDVWLTNGHLRNAHRLTHAGRFMLSPVAFSADGRSLLATTVGIHSGRPWAIDLPTHTLWPLTGPADIWPMDISRDGSTVLALGGACDAYPGGRGIIETIPFGGGKPHVVARGPCGASWNAG